MHIGASEHLKNCGRFSEGIIILRGLFISPGNLLTQELTDAEFFFICKNFRYHDTVRKVFPHKTISLRINSTAMGFEHQLSDISFHYGCAFPAVMRITCKGKIRHSLINHAVKKDIADLVPIPVQFFQHVLQERFVIAKNRINGPVHPLRKHPCSTFEFLEDLRESPAPVLLRKHAQIKPGQGVVIRNQLRAQIQHIMNGQSADPASSALDDLLYGRSR